MDRVTFFKTLLASVTAFFGLKKAAPKIDFNKSFSMSMWMSDDGRIGAGYNPSNPKPLFFDDGGIKHITLDCKGLPNRTVLNMWNDKGELIQYTQEDGKEMEVKNLGKGWIA